jgi:hypothetical protein
MAIEWKIFEPQGRRLFFDNCIQVVGIKLQLGAENTFGLDLRKESQGEGL